LQAFPNQTERINEFDSKEKRVEELRGIAKDGNKETQDVKNL
jgi:hypothetical protein